jgi:hypothetical protein
LDSRVLDILAHFCPFFRESTTSELYGIWIQNGPIFGNGRSHTTVRQKNKYLHGTTTQQKNEILLTPANLNHSDTAPLPLPVSTTTTTTTTTTSSSHASRLQHRHPEASHIRVTSGGGVGSTRSRCGFTLRYGPFLCNACAFSPAGH